MASSTAGEVLINAAVRFACSLIYDMGYSSRPARRPSVLIRVVRDMKSLFVHYFERPSVIAAFME
jgi:hypothetical protein